MKYDVNVELENRTEEYSFNEVARQANGAAWIKRGGTVILEIGRASCRERV